VVTPRWKEKVFEQVNGETKINRRYYELCVLEKLERALKCKEVWVEGSYDFRNPSEDLPSDWSDEQRRTLHYQALGKPLDAQAFVRLLRTRMEAALTNFNRVLPDLNHLRIFRPRQNDDRGLWALAKLERQPEPQSLGVIKEKIGSRYGMLGCSICSTFLLRPTDWSTSRDFSRIRAPGRSAPARRFVHC
jgi:hypothetical protein